MFYKCLLLGSLYLKGFFKRDRCSIIPFHFKLTLTVNDMLPITASVNGEASCVLLSLLLPGFLKIECNIS